MRNLFFILFMFCALTGWADERKALKLLEKKDFEKLVDVLNKDLEKDSLNPGAYYIYSLLYNDPLYEKHNLDTAYYFVLKAKSMMGEVDEKDLQKLEKLNITDSIISLHKSRLEYLAYERARSLNAIKEYNFYIEHFRYSDYRKQAIEDRNALAFQQAEQQNTFEAYHNFMQTYPGAIQTDEALKRYQRLLYESQTSNGKLESYEDFILNYPNSPYKEEAIKMIYRIKTCDNSEVALMNFIREFPHSPQVRDAIDRLYYNYIETGKTDFSYQFSRFPLNDSIKKVNSYYDQFLIPVYENDRYGFISSSGEFIIPYRFPNIDLNYLCGDIHDDYLIVSNGDKQIIVSKTGATIYDGPFYNVEDLGYGLLKLSNNGKYGLIFKTGKLILPIKYDDIQLLNSQLIKIRQDNQWQLYSLNGLLLLSTFFQNIGAEGNFLLLQKGGKWAVTNNQAIFDFYLKGDVNFNYTFDDYELIEANQILCMAGDRETVVGADLQRMIPLEEQRIFALPEGWLVKRDSLYDIYDDIFFKISGSGFKKVEYKGKWITGKTRDKWILYYNFAPFPDVFAYDSINILSNRFVLVFEEGKSSLLFTNLQKEELSGYSRIQILKYSLPDNTETGFVPEFIRVEFQNGKNVVYNTNGKEILKGDYDGIQALGLEYLRITRRGKDGLADTSGHVLIKPQYEGIANYQNGYVSLLNNKKFGIYNQHHNIYLKPAYDRLLKTYNDNFLIAFQKKGYGLIGTSGNKSTDLEFDDIRYWNDTSMLVKENDIWHLFDIINNDYIIENIFDYQILTNDGHEKTVLFTAEGNYGIINNLRGFIINPSFNDIVDIGSEEHPVYFAEKYIPEAEFYIVIYYDENGEVLRKQVFSDEEYDKIYCN